MSALDDAFHKLEWGKKHLSDFKEHIGKTFDKDKVKHEMKSNPYPKPFGTRDPRPWTLFSVYYSSVPAISKEDGILVGETIQAFRSSLDYLAWAYYIRSGRKSVDERQIAFPMAISYDSFLGQINQKLIDISANEMALVERYQPYQLTNAGRMIGYLRALSDTDKHRIILPAPMFPAYGEINIKYGKWAELILSPDTYELGQEIKKDTIIMSVILAGYPPFRNQVHVDATTTIVPAFPVDLIRPTPPDDIVPAELALDGIGDICAQILTEANNLF